MVFQKSEFNPNNTPFMSQRRVSLGFTLIDTAFFRNMIKVTVGRNRFVRPMSGVKKNTRPMGQDAGKNVTISRMNKRSGGTAMHRFFSVMVIGLLTSNLSARANPVQCKQAAESYNSVLDDISTDLKKYSRCVSDSQGHDDCSSDFRKLKSAQSDYEMAVANYASECQ